ncbi:peptidase inhibitor family I36 protein [Actinomadura sp. NPDC048955]|uniref:peptidase inhibitor family I36 protein n=1 Tax=Actinomadura sp. NPDC048955 TaxID=3158228 RepID=UPI0034074E3B
MAKCCTPIILGSLAAAPILAFTTTTATTTAAATLEGTGACTTGYFCLWPQTDYDGPVERIPPVQGPGYRLVRLARSGYNASTQGQYVWAGFSSRGCFGDVFYVPPPPAFP